MFCTQCGNRHEEPVGKFCTNCGAAVEQAADAPNAGASAVSSIAVSEMPQAPSVAPQGAATVAAAPPPATAAQPSAGPQVITNTIIVLTPKSVGMGVVLALFFGPLGLLYSSVKLALIMFVVALIVAVLTIGFGLILVNPICAFLAYRAVTAHNASMGAVATQAPVVAQSQ